MMSHEDEGLNQNQGRPPAGNNNPWFYLTIITTLFLAACLILQDYIGILFFAYLVAIGTLVYLYNEDDGDFGRASRLKKGKSRLGSKKFQPAFVEALVFPVFVLDATGKILYANNACKKAFGTFSNRENIFIRFRQPQLRRMIEQALKTSQAMSGEYQESVPRERWFGFEIAPVQKADKASSGKIFLLAFHDYTESKRIDRMRSDFIANASHELRTPLASLMGYIETIKGPARHDEEAIDRFTGIMLDQTQRMTRLVNDLLSLSRIEMQSNVRPSDSVDLSEVISNVIGPLSDMAEKLDVEIFFKPSGPVKVTGDRDELVQVFENLIENAVKYGQEGKKVVVSLEVSEDKKSVTATVQDFGPGIAMEHQHRITERFYRVDVTRSRETQGTGLGLAIVKHILNRHGTKLVIRSKPGEGAEFSVTFSIEDSN